jgi:hypothetical protein
MADDGSGQDISIPSFLMFKRDADLVKTELEANRPVQIEMAWSLPTDRVEYELWTTPSDIVSKDFLRSFKRIAEALGDRAYFTPHMYIYDGLRTHCQGNCKSLCTNNGRYCATDPDNGISGADVVRESLRRICIWRLHGQSNGIGKEWWDYVAVFNERCWTEYFTDEACIKDAYKTSKVDVGAIERCMIDSGGTEGDNTNSKLDYELTAQEQRGVVVIPTAYVNTAAIRRALNVNNVFTAICSGFLDGNMPEACMICGGCPDPLACVSKGVCWVTGGGVDGGGHSGISVEFFAVSMAMVVGIFGALVGAWNYKRLREGIWEQVHGIPEDMPLEGHYMPLGDHDMGGSKQCS